MGHAASETLSLQKLFLCYEDTLLNEKCHKIVFVLCRHVARKGTRTAESGREFCSPCSCHFYEYDMF